MKYPDNQYEYALAHVLTTGRMTPNRTGTPAKGVFGLQMRYDMANGFPLITTKYVSFKMVVAELLWFLSGSTNVKDLQAMGCHIWDEWADEFGDLGPIYGKQWRNVGKPNVDQIWKLVNSLKENPHSRRHVVSAWNVDELDEMALTPCHALFQCHVEQLTESERESILHSQPFHSQDKEHYAVPKYRLNLQLYQRSADMFLGVPFNIASYSLLLHMLAAQTGMVPGEFIWTGGDCHIYENHQEQVRQQLTRVPYVFPELLLDPAKDIFSYNIDHIVVKDYQHHPAIKGQVAV